MPIQQSRRCNYTLKSDFPWFSICSKGCEVKYLYSWILTESWLVCWNPVEQALSFESVAIRCLTSKSRIQTQAGTHFYHDCKNILIWNQSNTGTVICAIPVLMEIRSFVIKCRSWKLYICKGFDSKVVHPLPEICLKRPEDITTQKDQLAITDPEQLVSHPTDSPSKYESLHSSSTSTMTFNMQQLPIERAMANDKLHATVPQTRESLIFQQQPPFPDSCQSSSDKTFISPWAWVTFYIHWTEDLGLKWSVMTTGMQQFTLECDWTTLWQKKCNLTLMWASPITFVWNKIKHCPLDKRAEFPGSWICMCLSCFRAPLILYMATYGHTDESVTSCTQQCP